MILLKTNTVYIYILEKNVSNKNECQTPVES